MDYYPISDLNVFTARISATKTKIRGQSYISYRLTVPKKIVEKMGLNDGDHLLLIAKKAKWYHLLDWDDEHFSMLPENIRLEISAIDNLQNEGMIYIQIATPNPLGNTSAVYSAGGTYDRNFSGTI